MKFKLLIIAIFLFAISDLFSQVMVYPQVVFMNNKITTGKIDLENKSEKEMEVNISLIFGYPSFDSTGKTFMQYKDSISEKSFSIAPNLSFFPKKIVLKPKEFQTVKFLLKNYNKLSDGTYWARIVTKAKEMQLQYDTTNVKDVKIGMNLEFAMITALIFEKGKVNSSIELTTFKQSTDSLNINFIIGFEKKGNSPLFGTAELLIKTENGEIIENSKSTTPIYFSSAKAFSFEKAKFKSGKYSFNIKLTNEQKDVPKDFKIPFNEVSKTFEFTINNE